MTPHSCSVSAKLGAEQLKQSTYPLSRQSASYGQSLASETGLIKVEVLREHHTGGHSPTLGGIGRGLQYPPIGKRAYNDRHDHVAQLVELGRYCEGIRNHYPLLFSYFRCTTDRSLHGLPYWLSGTCPVHGFFYSVHAFDCQSNEKQTVSPTALNSSRQIQGS